MTQFVLISSLWIGRTVWTKYIRFDLEQSMLANWIKASLDLDTKGDAKYHASKF